MIFLVRGGRVGLVSKTSPIKQISWRRMRWLERESASPSSAHTEIICVFLRPRSVAGEAWWARHLRTSIRSTSETHSAFLLVRTYICEHLAIAEWCETIALDGVAGEFLLIIAFQDIIWSDASKLTFCIYCYPQSITVTIHSKSVQGIRPHHIYQLHRGWDTCKQFR